MSKRKIKIRSGKEEAWMEVTEEEYWKCYRPWWQEKKREQRNRESTLGNSCITSKNLCKKEYWVLAASEIIVHVSGTIPGRGVVHSEQNCQKIWGYSIWNAAGKTVKNRKMYRCIYS